MFFLKRFESFLFCCVISALSVSAALNSFDTTVNAQSVDIHSLIEISGELPPVLKKGKQPYIVVSDIIVSPGKSVTVEPGVIFLFKNFTGIQIHGALTAEGTKGKPIIFSSENDGKYNPFSSASPAPYDWNGITITENAFGTKFKNCKIQYSLYGIKSLTEYVFIKETEFYKNGRNGFSVKGEKKETGSVPYTYLPPGGNLLPPELLAEVAPKRSGRIVFRVLSIMAFAGGIAYGGWQVSEYLNAKREFDILNDPDNQSNWYNPTLSGEWDTAKENRDKHALYAAGGFGLGSVGVIGFTIPFFLNREKEKSSEDID